MPSSHPNRGDRKRRNLIEPAAQVDTILARELPQKWIKDANAATVFSAALNLVDELLDFHTPDNHREAVLAMVAKHLGLSVPQNFGVWRIEFADEQSFEVKAHSRANAVVCAKSLWASEVPGRSVVNAPNIEIIERIA